MTDEIKPKKLTKREQAFITEYVACLNGAEAARRAGYSEANARVIASQNLAKLHIKAEVERLLAEKAMSANEVLARLTDMATGDIAQLMDVSGMGFNLDMKKAKETGLTKLIKRVKQRTTTYLAKGESGEDREVTELEIELYDAQSALVQLGKYHKLFTTVVETKDLTSKKDSELVREFAELVDTARTRAGIGAGGGDTAAATGGSADASE